MYVLFEKEMLLQGFSRSLQYINKVLLLDLEWYGGYRTPHTHGCQLLCAALHEACNSGVSNGEVRSK